MTTGTLTAHVLGQVANRLQLASVGKRFYLCTAIVSVVYAAALLVGRLAGFRFEWFEFNAASLLVIPAVALLTSLLWHHRPTRAEAARAVDQHNGTKDLFLTCTMLDNSRGQYKPLVLQDAERQAPRVDPHKVVPLRWAPRLGHLSAAAVVLLLGVLYLPQLDPFGQVAAAQSKQLLDEQLRKDSKATELRTAQLKKDSEADKESEKVDKAIDDLMSSFRKMKRNEKQPNLEKLNEHQKDIGTQWRKLGTEKLKTLLSKANSFQDFGGQRQQKLRKWNRELMDGSTEGLNKELNALAEQLQEMMQETDPVKRSEMARQMKQQLRDLERFASENVGSPELSAAVRRALRQLEAAENGEKMSTKALESLAESLDLTKLELEQIAKSVKNMKALEEALEVLQAAKQLNADELLDGEAAAEFQTLSDYAEFYAQIMGQGDGEGTGGEGFGRGGEVPEDDSVASDFKTEQSKAAVRAGKILMSLSGKGLSDSGDVQKNYRQLMGQVKQGVSEAILQEQIPPGYHDGIRQYFDNIEIVGNDEAEPADND